MKRAGRLLSRFVSCTLSATLIISSVSIPSAVARAVPLKPTPVRQELVEKRTAYSNSFDNGDGTFTYESYQVPINFKDRTTGAYVPIDSSLEETGPASARRWRNKANTFDLSLPARVGGGAWVSIETSAGSVGMRPVAARVPGLGASTESTGQLAATLSDSVTYPRALPAADVAYESTARGLKESIVLPAWTGTSTFSFQLRTKGLTPRLEADGSIAYLSADSTTPVFVSPPGFMTDSAGGTEEGTYSDAVHYQLVRDALDWRLDVTADAAWLADPARVYPVRIDPSVYYDVDKTLCDTYVAAGNPTTNYGTSTMLRTGSWSESGMGVCRAFVKPAVLTDGFVTGGQAASWDVLQADLKLYCYGTFTGQDVDLEVAEITSSWTENGVTWNTRPTQTDDSIVHVSPPGWAEFPVTDIVDRWVSGESPMYGIAVYATTSANAAKFYTRDSASSAKPTLSIRYAVRPNVTLIDPGPDVAVAGRPTLRWDFLDPIGKVQTAGQFEIKRSGSQTLAWSSGTVSLAPMQNSLPITDTSFTLQPGRYYVRMRAASVVAGAQDAWSLWTPWRPFDCATLTEGSDGGGMLAYHASDDLGGGARVDLATGRLQMSRSDFAGPGTAGLLGFGLAYDSRLTTDTGFGPGWRLALPSVTVTDQIAPNPGFEAAKGVDADPADWMVSDTTKIDRDTSQAHSGTASVKMSSPTGSAFTSLYISDSPDRPSSRLTVPAQRYDLSFWVKTSALAVDPAQTEQGIRPRIIWYDDAGTELSSTLGEGLVQATTSGWVKRTLSAVAPAGAQRARLVIDFKNARGTAWIDDVEWRDGTRQVTSAVATTRIARQAGGGTYTRDPLDPDVALKTVNAATGAKVSSNATGAIGGYSLDGLYNGVAVSGNAGNDSCTWSATGSNYLQYDLTRPRVVDRVRLYLWDGEESTPRTYTYSLQVRDAGGWCDVGAGTQTGSGWQTVTFEPLRARSVRILARGNTADARFQVCEFELPVLTIDDSPASFDASGNLTAIADPSDNIIRYRRDAASRLVAVEETSTGRGVDLAWDGTALDHLDWRGIDSMGAASTENAVAGYEYSASARALTISMPSTSGVLAAATVIGYDTSGRISSLTDADGLTTTVGYDGSGRVSSVARGPAGLRVTNTYAYSGTSDEPVVAIQASGQDGASLSRAVTMSAALGHQLTQSTTDPNGAALTSTYGYDTYGHVRSVTSPAGTDTLDVDSHGRVWRTNEKGARETTATYADDRLRTSTDALGNVSSFAYDSCGRLTESTTRVSEEASAGVYSALQSYDEWGNRTLSGAEGSASLNKVLNGTFEIDPATLGWTGTQTGFSWRAATGIYDQPHLGARLAVLDGGSAGASLRTDPIHVTTSATYTAEVWASGSGRLMIRSYDAAGVAIASPIVARSAEAAPSSGSKLRRISGTCVMPGNADNIRVYLIADAGQTAAFDNVRFERAGSAGDDNFVENASAEAGVNLAADNWIVRPNTSADQERISRDSFPPVSGAWSLHLGVTQGNSGALMSTWIPVRTGEQYTFGGYMAVTGFKSSGEGPVDGPAIMIQTANPQLDMNVDDYPQATPSGMTGNSPWRRYSTTYTVPAGVAYVRMYVRGWNMEGDVWFDSVFLGPVRTQGSSAFDTTTHSFEVTQTTNTGRVLTSYFDARGRVRQTAFRASSASTTSTVLSASDYDAAGRLAGVGVRAAADQTITASYSYTAGGRLSAITDPNGHTSRIAYDQAGRLTTVTVPSGLASVLAYDSLGRLRATFRPGSGNAVRLTQSAYDSAGRPKTTTFFDAGNATATVSTIYYDSASRPATLTLTGETAGSLTNTYDALSRVTGIAISGPGGSASVSTVYDRGDRPTSTSWTALGTTGSVASGYAQTGEWLSTSSFGRDFRFGWSSAGRLESVASSYTVTNLGLDAYGRPASVRTGFAGASGFFGPYASHELAYDEMDRISRITASGPSVASTQTFGYDLADRLTSWTRDGAQTTYGYDPSGNMTGVNAAGTQTTLAYNVDDQLTTSTVGSVVTTYGNDVLGRRTSQRSQTSTMTTTYGYNAMGKLSSFAAPGVSASYLYGATGMREVKVVTRGSAAATTSVLWSGNKPVVEQDGDGTILRYLYGPGGMPLSVQVTRSGSTSTYHYLTDGLGSVSSLVSETGTVAATYTYDPWGTVTSVGGADTWLASRQPLRYRAYYLDAESGLYYLPARYYDPKTCRFLSADPAAPSAGSPQSLNRYAYCEDDPIGMTDPSGAVLVEFYRQDERSRIGEIALVEARIQHAGSGGLKHAGKAVQDAALRSAMAREVAVAFAIGTPRPAYSLPRSIGDGTPYGRGNLRIGELSPPGYVDYGLAVVGTALDLRGGLPGVVVGIGVDAAAGFAYYIPRQLSGEGTFGDTVLGFAGMIPGVSEAMAIIYAYDALTRALGGAGISWTQPDN